MRRHKYRKVGEVRAGGPTKAATIQQFERPENPEGYVPVLVPVGGAADGPFGGRSWMNREAACKKKE